MRLKSVELFGFKSFPDRTVIDFGDGITGVLGPNGCGKSNVVDAIKWVLGEKSAKNLRGDEMLDVIFSGCGTRSPSGMAEVKLNFDNTDQTIPLPYNEVSVGRRLFRSRESEYFINQNKCRLKDIRDLFLDTGVGNTGYWVIEQGRVDALLHAKPADRRAVLEEAAGIAKFKVKRKEILGRLERTEQILLRVNDRVEEKERQIRKVATQAANARRHRILTETRDAARTLLYRRQFDEQCALREQLAQQREALESELDREERTLAALNEEFTRLTGEEAELSRNRDAVVHDTAAIQEQLSAIQVEQTSSRNRIETLSGEMGRSNARRAELTSRLWKLKAQESDLDKQLAEAREGATGLEERFREQDRHRQELARAAEESERETTRLRNYIIDLNRRRQELAANAARLEAAEQSSSQRLAEIEEALAAILREEEEVSGVIARLEEEYREAASGYGSLADRLEAVRAEIRERTALAERLQNEERTVLSERSAKASRKATLEDMENSFAGAHEGVKNILTAAKNHHPDCRGVIGMALDLMTVPQDLALAVETILGSAAQDVVVETARDAQAAIELLKRDRLGRATFLPLDRIQPRRRLSHNFRSIPGVIGEAVDLVDYDRRYQTVMEHLLAGILVVDTLSLARELAGREARGVRIVTLEGDIVNPSGSMSGGHGRQRTFGLVQRKAELDALVDDLAACEARLAEKSRLRAEAADAITRLGQEASDIERSLAEAGRTEGGLKQSLAVKRSEQERIRRDRSQREAERLSLTDGDEGRLQELALFREQLAEAEVDMSRSEADLTTRSEEQRRNREATESLGQEFAKLSGDRSAALSRVRELETKLTEMTAEQAACREELDRPGVTHAEAQSEIAALRRRLAELEANEADLLRRRDEGRSTGIELAERLQECRTRSEALRLRERESQSQCSRLREGLSVIGRQDDECRIRLENVQEKARLELELELYVPAQSDGESTGLSEDGGLAPPSRPDEPEAAADPELAALSDAELQSKIEEASQKLRNIGAVNPDAIAELAELEAGAEFLRSHKEEQEEAVESMRTSIERLNEESSTRFQETFAAVRTSFQDIFVRLFGGGRADMILEEVTEPGADPLDAGIDISAQPPGKEPKSISLLSGGEKALCAVALLFALFRSKPSPFCILDEVDAPLDESNIDRFMGLVKDFTDDTQFIIITHSKRTMGMTDTIWGVTHEIPGISAVRSLKFNAMENLSREKTPATEELLTASGA